MTGDLSVNEACDELGVGPTQFANLRAAALQGYLDALQPKPVGRPRRVPVEVEEEMAVLRQQVAALEHENERLRIQLELVSVTAAGRAVRSKSRGRTSPKGSAAARRAIP